jgi:hypothetical protein
MAIDQVDQTVVTEERPPVAGQTAAPPITQETVRTDSRQITRSGPGGSEMARRIIVLVFGLSKIFVAPFEGILNSNALTAGGSTLDVAAVVAFVGWTILELIVLWAVGIFRREPA